MIYHAHADGYQLYQLWNQSRIGGGSCQPDCSSLVHNKVPCQELNQLSSVQHSYPHIPTKLKLTQYPPPTFHYDNTPLWPLGDSAKHLYRYEMNINMTSIQNGRTMEPTSIGYEPPQNDQPRVPAWNQPNLPHLSPSQPQSIPPHLFVTGSIPPSSIWLKMLLHVFEP